MHCICASLVRIGVSLGVLLLSPGPVMQGVIQFIWQRLYIMLCVLHWLWYILTPGRNCICSNRHVLSFYSLQFLSPKAVLMDRASTTLRSENMAGPRPKPPDIGTKVPFDFIPYNPDRDALLSGIGWDDVGIECIPPTVGAYGSELPVAQRQEIDAKKRQVFEELDLPYYIVGKPLFEHIWWADACEKNDLPVDYSRVLRYGLCRNEFGLAEALRRKADLSHMDTLGRSALFYGLWPFPDDSILISITRPLAALLSDCHDAMGKTLLDYAVQLRSPAAVEVLTALNVGTPKIEFGPDYQPLFGSQDLSTEISPETQMPVNFPELCIGHILAFRKWFGELHSHPCGALFVDGVSEPLRQLLQWRGAEGSWSKTIWVHFNAFSGAAIFSFLDCCAIADEPSISPAPISRPSLDTSWFASNLEENSVYELAFDRQIYIALPSVTMRPKRAWRHWRNASKDEWKVRYKDYYSHTSLRLEPTLDEVYYPSLSSESLEIRDQSQVVSREYKENERRWGDNSTPILMVQYLWLRRIGGCILTTYSAPGDEEGDYVPPHVAIDKPAIQIAFILVNHLIRFGGRGSIEGNIPPPLDIFEQAVVGIIGEVDDYVRSSGASSGPEMEKEHDFMYRIADIREELVMIEDVLLQQQNIMATLIEDFENNDPDIVELLAWKPQSTSPEDLSQEEKEWFQALRTWKSIKRDKGQIEGYMKRVRKIDGDAERIEKRIQDQLNLKRTHASIKDARTSLLLGTAVIGFTVVTVIFAPLAFMTALFALPIDTFVRNQILFNRTGSSTDSGGQADPTPAYTSGYVATWFIVTEIISLGLTLLLVWVSVRGLGGTENLKLMLGWKTTGEEQSKEGSRPEKETGEQTQPEKKRGRLDPFKERAGAMNEKLFSEPREQISGLFRRRKGPGNATEEV
ncbi:hypothetical protein F5Y17DRAFT_340528 [Xylariaceae sp. FL0594]|nr:hypothetical protein F5Y17DRAFT_340528 [Xylariaceae sp. FL0594]